MLALVLALVLPLASHCRWYCRCPWPCVVVHDNCYFIKSFLIYRHLGVCHITGWELRVGGANWGQSTPLSTPLPPRFGVLNFKLFALKLDVNKYLEVWIQRGSGKLEVVFVFQNKRTLLDRTALLVYISDTIFDTIARPTHKFDSIALRFAIIPPETEQ